MNNYLSNKVRMVSALMCAVVLSGAAESCSVKEDRVPCPCYLNVGFQDADREAVREDVNLLGWNSAEIFSESIHIQDYEPYWVKPVRKGVFNFSASRGSASSNRDGHLIRIPLGRQSDSLYAFHDEIAATGDMVYSDVLFHKQFCTVFLDIMKTEELMKGFVFEVEGNTCGFDLFNFAPVPGQFLCQPVPGDNGRIVPFRLPRQSDNSIVLKIFHKDNETDAREDYVSVGNFPLGEYIARTGYDWKTVDLQDVYITIDLVLGYISIKVEGWEEGFTYSFIEQ